MLRHLSKNNFAMYVLAMISLKEVMKIGSPFSFIITFATFYNANKMSWEKSSLFLCFAWQCVLYRSI